MSVFHQNILAGASGAGGAAEALYVDDVFSTLLYRNDTNAERDNGIDLSSEGGLVVTKFRSGSSEWGWTDSERGITKSLDSSTSSAEATEAWISSFDDDGFTTGSYLGTTDNADIVSWTFRKTPGFFDVVTYTGNGTAGRTVSHSLGSVPGCIIVKCTSQSYGWFVFHRSTGNAKHLRLDSNTSAASSTRWNSTDPTSTEFTVGDSATVNGSGETYVAYIFAHNDQSFGTDSDEAIIKCDSVTMPSSGYQTSEINLGFEPQFLLLKTTTFSPSNWHIFDNMRGITTGSTSYSGHDALLQANVTNAEGTGVEYVELTPNGFKITIGQYGTSQTIAYMAIRRPHKPPTAGTEVFKTVAGTYSAGSSISQDFPIDLVFAADRSNATAYVLEDRLRGFSPTNGNAKVLKSHATNAETSAGNPIVYEVINNNLKVGSMLSSYSATFNFFRRAPGFFDVVCFTGANTSTQTVSHNLGAVPEFFVVKKRDSTSSWQSYHASLGNTKYVKWDQDAEELTSSARWNNTTPTATQFTLGSQFQDSNTYVAYLFATLDGISKVGSYTGTGNNIDVDCGFTAGARFVLIKRSDTNLAGSTGDWYIYDSARGIVSGNDPYLFLNETSAEVTNTDYIDPLNSGFTVTSSAPVGLNASGGTYIFLAIA